MLNIDITNVDWPQTVFAAALLFWAAGAAGSLLFRKNDSIANWWGNSFAILGSVSGLVSALSVLITGSGFSYSAASTIPLLTFSFFVDKLSAFFIFTISLIALLASIYAIGYVKHYYRRYNLGTLGFFYNIFLAGMILVVSAHQALFFLLVWEIMSLASYFLVIYEHGEESNVKAGALYFIMTHIGTAFITFAFLLLFSVTGSFDFGIMKENIGAASPLLKNAVFLLALVGFGTKAGIIPFHIWLPSAHPAAPSHVSSLMSGVMIKTGIYMFIRIFMDVLPDAPMWWGIVLLLMGAVSSLLGVLYALTEHDIKRLLAYHSIENIGIILLGLGGSLVFWSFDMKPLAILGLVAALFHTLNHAIFKALLFMGAGSVISETHTRNMEEMGGLIKFMPLTAFFFLVGSMAISALPPFNGFMSEWMTFQSLFAGIGAIDNSVRWVFILGAGSLAFTGGLAAMCFVKAFGATFLARPRSEEVKHAKDAGITLRIAMGTLATLTLVIGTCAGPVINILSGVAQNLSLFASSSRPFSSNAATVQLQNGFASISMPLLLAILLAVFGATVFAVSMITRGRRTTIGHTWDCGSNLNPRMEITSTGFARSIVTIFCGVLKPTKQTGIEYRDEDMRYFPKISTVELGVQDVYNKYFYNPLLSLTTIVATKVRSIQSGNVNMYILYIFLILIALLFFSNI